MIQLLSENFFEYIKI